jgi:Flp pilus assembly protein TadG
VASLSRHLRAQGSRGQSLVEVALVVPLLLSLLGFSADLARAFFVNTQVSNSAREGALYAGHHYGDAADPSFATFKANVTAAIAAEESTPLIGCPAANRTVTLTPDPGPTYPQTSTTGPGPYQLTVQVDCTIKPIVSWLPTPNPMHLTAKTTAYVYKLLP